MAKIEIRPARKARERMAFIKMPWKLYRNDPHWVPPLIADMKSFIDPGKGPFFEHGQAELLLAFRDGKPAGRISAHVSDRHQELHGDNKGFFGFFECEDDQAVANALFAAAERFIRDKGRTAIEGPYSFGIYDEIGILVEGFDSMPYVFNIHNPPYYQRLIEQAGYGKSIDWYAFRISNAAAQQKWPEKLVKIKDRIMKRQSVTFRTMDKAHYEREARYVKEIFDAAWSQNWGHTAATDREFLRIAEALKQLFIPELSLFAEVDGRPVGFAVSLYDANPLVREIDGHLFPLGFVKLLTKMKKTDRFRLLFMGVLNEYRNRGYEVVFATEVMQRGIKLGYRECEMSNIVETNDAMLRSLEHLPGERYKTYRIFKKELEGSPAN